MLTKIANSVGFFITVGLGMTSNGSILYTTNISNGGTKGLVTLGIKGNSVKVLFETDTPRPVPHNIAVTGNNKYVYITHSGGTSTALSKYSVGGSSGFEPVLMGDVITVGLNPFGLDFVP